MKPKLSPETLQALQSIDAFVGRVMYWYSFLDLPTNVKRSIGGLNRAVIAYLRPKKEALTRTRRGGKNSKTKSKPRSGANKKVSK